MKLIKNHTYLIPMFIIAIFSIATVATGASVFFPFQGGTGTSTVPATGEILAGNGSLYEIEPLGTDGHVLTADSASSNGVKWAAAGSVSQTPWTQAIDADGYDIDLIGSATGTVFNATGSPGFRVVPGSDQDTTLLELAVTGEPTLSWDESEDTFSFSKKLSVPGGILASASSTIASTLRVTGAVTLDTDLTVANGGTGASSLTDGGILLGSGTGAITAMSVLADGAIVVGDGTTDPVALTAFTGSTGDVLHEAGGLEADVSAFTGLIAISGGATSEVDAKSELETQIADVSDFAEADGDVYTGTHDFGGADDLEIPNGTGITIDTQGQIGIDVTDNQLIYYGTSSVKVLHYEKSISFSVLDPDPPTDVLIAKAQNAITIVDIHCIAQGGTSITLEIYESNATHSSTSTVDDALTCDTDGAAEGGNLTNATIDAGDWYGFILRTESGSLRNVNGTIYYTIDRQ